MSARDDRAGDKDAQGEPFLRRWARLKLESRQAEPAAEPPVPMDGAVAAGPASQPEASAAAEDPKDDSAEPRPCSDAETAELPPIESLTAESDFGPFMKSGVDPALRRMALRKMWQNPKYAVVDELDPFRADFAAFTPLGDVITSDMKFHAERLLREQMEKAAEAAEASAVEPDDVAASDTATEGPAAGPDETAAGGADVGAVAEDESGTPTEDGDDRRHG